MIVKTYGEFIPVCDVCGEDVYVSFGSFDEALDWMRANGWKTNLTKEGWENVCATCNVLSDFE